MSLPRTLLHRFSPVFRANVPALTPRLFCQYPQLNTAFRHPSIRQNSSSTSSSPSANSISLGKLEPEGPPSYQLTFTCRPCRERSTHTVSKQAYHKGTVLIQCPGCKNRHVFADHLKIFGDKARTLEDILSEQGEVLKRGRILPNGDVEVLPEEGSEKTE